jgi:tRNA pseudouridine38-40 synthase
MRKAAEKLEGCHDFKGFCSKASKKKSTVRRIDSITIFEKENDICLRFEGNGFLYNMVRILTGTLVEIGSGVRKPDTIDEVFAGGERRLAGETAPAQGLTLVSVKYD